MKNNKSTKRILITIATSISMLFSVLAKSDEIREIDRTIWQPFVDSWYSMDGKKNVSLHTADTVRVMEHDNTMSYGEAYLGHLKKMMSMMGKKGVTSKLEMKFSNIITKGNVSWESGIYRAEMNHPERGKMVNYGEFDVLLEKVDGKWKIKLDRDKPSTEEAFNKIAAKTVVTPTNT